MKTIKFGKGLKLDNLMIGEYFIIDKKYVWFPKIITGAKMSNDELNLLKSKEQISQEDKIKWLSFCDLGTRRPNRSNKVTSLSAFLTTKCNLRCVYCYGSGGEINLPDLTAEEIEIILQTYPSIKGVNFHGWGEPTLRMDIIRSIVEKYGNRYNWNIGSNGIYFNRREEIANFFKKYNFNITLSLDGIANINDKQRPLVNGKGATNEVLKTIKIFQDLDVRFGIRATISKAGLERMIEFIKWLKTLGIKSIKLEPLWIRGRSKGLTPYDTDPNLVKFGRKLVEAWILGKKIGIKVSSTFLPFAVRTCFCMATESTALVLYNNRYLGTCWEEMLYEESPFIIGKIEKNKDNKYKVIMFGDRINILKKRSNIYMTDSKCIKCPLKYACAGGCPYKSYCNFNSLNTPGENKQSCKARREILKLILKETLK